MTIPRLTPQGVAEAQPVARHHLTEHTRRYHALWLDRFGAIQETEQDAPATPPFEAAHSAFVRGTLVSTPRGPLAVEDLLPGDKVLSVNNGPLAVHWIGSMTMHPDGAPGPTRKLTRIMADAFGINRPLSDLMTGPGARLLSRPRHLRDRLGSDHVLTPPHAMADGHGAVCITPRQPVTLYHLCLRRHAVICVNGLQAESYHPGTGLDRALDARQLRQFLSLFPHIRDLRDFGPLAHLRLPLDAPETLDLA
ncbi:hypothetical protein RA2_01413 [Roseovarius sp. A-2]|uniref:Hint domain-containing protein n=1 Tax=Roseovarius sp. A-2 TaxID=1570360 RepID=UPI0009B55B0C|nr:Hint domain-containing protein [Roseovarius sp. A-2]GAW34365.1 hypothetical protein RA2_01413 [Roseovarius sp. A-2]